MKRLVHEEINKNPGIDSLPPLISNVFRIVDIGCSTGPNTFLVVQDIIEVIKSKYQRQDIEFQVLFNYLISNDFNTLFSTLPTERNYFAAGVPGSFHGRLFPKACLHYVHSSYTLHWISKIPEEVQDKSSPAWNKGRIHYGRSSKQVVGAYATQFAKDFVSFLEARAEEIVDDGFMALLVVGTPMEVHISKCDVIAAFEVMGSTLMDMAKMGLVDEAKVDSFNFPLYSTSLVEVKNLVGSNGLFKIEKIQETPRPVTLLCKQDVENYISFLRAFAEPRIKNHFGAVTTDEFFIRFTEKLCESWLSSDLGIVPMVDIFVFLRRQSQ